VLKRIASLGLLDRSRKVLERGAYVEIPVREAIPDCDVVQQREPSFYRRGPDLAALLKGAISHKEAGLLPRGWYILGEVIVVKIHPCLEPHYPAIGQALLSMYPRCKTVLRDLGIDGPLREPKRVIIAGAGTETLHKENKVTFLLDAQKVMFSAGNLRERMRMSLLGKDEYVVDMFAGIGYFSLQMAVHSRPRRIMAIELNPVAFEYLCRNAALNRVQHIVEPVLGDCAKLAPQGLADRVIMGMVQVTDRYLKTGVQALRSGGVLHYHQTIPVRRFPGAAVEDVESAARDLGCEAEILRCVRVKKYSPGMVHAVVDARIDK